MSRWPKVALSDLILRVERFEDRDDFKTYTFGGTYSYARGIFVSGKKVGSSFALPRIQRIRKGDFVYCKIMAWEGAFGVVPTEADNCVLSNAFVVYKTNQRVLDINFLGYYFKVSSHWNAIGSQSTGTNVRRQSLHPSQFEKYQIPLPPIEKQHAIVTRLDAIADKVRQVEAKLDEIEADLNNICRGLVFSTPNGLANIIPMREFLTLRRPDVLVSRKEIYHFAGVYSFGRGVFKSVVKSGADFSYEWLSTIRTGDFTYPKLMAWEGGLGVVPPECDGLVVSPEFPVFSVNTDIVLPEVLDVYFRTPHIWSQLADISTGTNQRRRRLQPSAFLDYKMPVPLMSIQKQLLEVLKRGNEIKSKHTETRQALKALLPSMLEQIFRNHN
jgi:type I restriction enzyme S subunit